MKHIVISAIYLIILFCLSEYVFNPTYLYYELPWLDIPMHILGGFGVASLTWSIFSFKGIKISFKKILLAYFIVAITWEIWEYYNAIVSYTSWNGWLDTIMDLFNGFIGISIAYFFLKH